MLEVFDLMAHLKNLQKCARFFFLCGDSTKLCRNVYKMCKRDEMKTFCVVFFLLPEQSAGSRLLSKIEEDC